MSRASDLKIIEIGPREKKKIVRSPTRRGHPSASILAGATGMNITTNLLTPSTVVSMKEEDEEIEHFPEATQLSCRARPLGVLVHI